MMRCIELAKKGLGTTYPNPLVGSIIVYKDKIIGEGWHHSAGNPHAEVLAIQSVRDSSLLKEATIYVSLEPCSHFGKTPPCSNLIIEKGIKNIVIGSSDPNPKVFGKGIEKLKKAGCNVTVGVLKKECDHLNRRFFSYHINNRPYIILKWAKSQDEFIAPYKDFSSQNESLQIPKNRLPHRVKKKIRKDARPVWITNKRSRQLAHKWRSEEQAILVGTQTVLDDNPSLTTRDWQGASPIRIVLDRSLKIPQDSTIIDGEVKTIVITEQEIENNVNLLFERIDFSKEISSQICDILYCHQIQSVIIEGGSKTLQTFIDSGNWDEARVFKGAVLFKEGIKSPVFSGTIISKKNIKEDQLRIYTND